VNQRLTAATRALARIDGLSPRDRAVIVGLLKIGRVGVEINEEGSTTLLGSLVECPFRWSEFDRWQAFFTARGTFPRGWTGLQVVPPADASARARVAYRRRKLGLLLEWLDTLTRRTAERDHYLRRGLRVRIVRQDDGHQCPVCEAASAIEVTLAAETMPPLHPGCRCVLMAARTIPSRDEMGRHRHNGYGK
jgi:hypothetical protein